MPSYTEISVSNYNAATAPSDDGTVTATNKIDWSIIKTKLSDPLKTAIEAMNTNIAAAIVTITANLATEAADLVTANSNYTNQITGKLLAPAGTAMLFMSTAVPTGWTKGSTHNNKALRLITGTVGTGGSTAFTSVFTSRTILEANMPTHSHSINLTDSAVDFSYTSIGVNATISENGRSTASATANGVTGLSESTDDLSGTGTVGGATGSIGSGTAMDFAVRYVDIVIGTKDA